MDKCELVKKAVDILKKTHDLDGVLENVRETDDGGVDFTLIRGTNEAYHNGGFPPSGFNPDHDKSEVVRVNLDKIPEELDDEGKIVAKMMLYLWATRNDN